jgi:hypothetical protein
VSAEITEAALPTSPFPATTLFGGEALSGETKPEDFHDLQDGKELGIAVGARCSIEVSRDRPYRF